MCTGGGGCDDVDLGLHRDLVLLADLDGIGEPDVLQAQEVIEVEHRRAVVVGEEESADLPPGLRHGPPTQHPEVLVLVGLLTLGDDEIFTKGVAFLVQHEVGILVEELLERRGQAHLMIEPAETGEDDRRGMHGCLLLVLGHNVLPTPTRARGLYNLAKNLVVVKVWE